VKVVYVSGKNIYLSFGEDIKTEGVEVEKFVGMEGLLVSICAWKLNWMCVSFFVVSVFLFELV
jgi:hypothetical protein